MLIRPKIDLWAYMNVFPDAAWFIGLAILGRGAYIYDINC